MLQTPQKKVEVAELVGTFPYFLQIFIDLNCEMV